MSHPILDKWDNGETVWSLEMGGLGPGYEQALQMAAIEALRELTAYVDAGNELPDDEDELNAELHRIMDPGLMRIEGLSGAQAGVAKQLAWHWHKRGEEGLLEEAKKQGVADSRKIQISNHWPQVNEAANEPS